MIKGRHSQIVVKRLTLVGIKITNVFFLFLFYLLPLQILSTNLVVHAQQPTVSIPTVTGTPIGTYIKVYADREQINVRSGPGVEYPKVGVLTRNQEVPALGRSVGGNWIQVVFPGVKEGKGWVFSPLVKVYGDLIIVEPPPLPTPRITPTIDPTLAAQFFIEEPEQRLPTFTPAPPVIIPTYIVEETLLESAKVPMGLVIVSLGLVGAFGVLISFLRGR